MNEMQNGKESPLYEPLWFRKVLLTYLQLSTSRNLSTYFVIYVHHKATFSLQVFPPSFVLILGGVQHCPPRACTDPPPYSPHEWTRPLGHTVYRYCLPSSTTICFVPPVTFPDTYTMKLLPRFYYFPAPVLYW